MQEKIQSKKCGKCKEIKSIDMFCKCKSKKDGYHSTCKLCGKESNKKWREINKEKIKKHRKIYQSTSEFKKHYKNYSKKWREANKEKKKSIFEMTDLELLHDTIKLLRKRLYNKNYIQKNKERNKEKNKQWWQRNKEIENEKRRQKNSTLENKDKKRIRQHNGYWENPEKSRETKRKNYQKNKEKNLLESWGFAKIYLLNNGIKLLHCYAEIEIKRKEKRKEKRREYERNRKKNDLGFKISHNLRTEVYQAVKSQGAKKSAHTMELIGCTILFLIDYITSLFKPGMSWKNYGIGGWEIDHIIPCDSFDLTKPEEQRKCFHYTNLQPLWAKDNRSKGNKII